MELMSVNGNMRMNGLRKHILDQEKPTSQALLPKKKQHQQQQLSAKDYVLEAAKDKQTVNELAEFVVGPTQIKGNFGTFHRYAVNLAHSIGFVGLLAEHNGGCVDLSVTPPMTLLPSPFPRGLYQKAIAVQETLNELYFRISLDHDFLVEAYREVVKADTWVARQVEMMERVHAEGVRQKVVVQIQRVDYMTHSAGDGQLELKQIEVNLGPGGPGFAPKMSKLHKRTLAKAECLHGGPLPLLANAKLPERRPIAEALFQAWKQFGDPQALAVLVFDSDLYPIQHHEHVQFVQFSLEKLARAEGFCLNVVRMTLEQCAERMSLDEQGDFSLLVDGQRRVGLVYMVYGYLPEHYPTEKEWQCQLAMERSTAIVSPNIRSQLSGTKKVQQLLAKPGVLERFLPDRPANKLAELRSTFTGLWALDSDAAQQKQQAIEATTTTSLLIADAVKHPQNYVLKALRDDGVGNFFDEQLAQMLRQMSAQERSAYILQQKIRPIGVKNYLKRPFGLVTLETIVNELGIFGTFVGTSEGKALWNRVDGHVIKSKAYGSNQGGIGEGSGVIDSAVLLPDSEFF